MMMACSELKLPEWICCCGALNELKCKCFKTNKLEVAQLKRNPLDLPEKYNGKITAKAIRKN